MITIEKHALRYGKSSEDDFKNVYHAFKEIIERYAFYLTSSRQNVEDTTQDIFLKIWLHWPKLGNLSKEELEDYVYTMTKHYIINVSRRKKSERKYIAHYLERISETYVHDEILLAEGLKVYRQAVEQLSTKQKQVYLYYEKDYRRVQIAASMGRSENTINNQLNAAFKRVRKYLNKNFDLNIHEDARSKIYNIASLN